MNKKYYIAPNTQVVDLDLQLNILAGSQPDDTTTPGFSDDPLGENEGLD